MAQQTECPCPLCSMALHRLPIDLAITVDPASLSNSLGLALPSEEATGADHFLSASFRFGPGRDFDDLGVDPIACSTVQYGTDSDSWATNTFRRPPQSLMDPGDSVGVWNSGAHLQPDDILMLDPVASDSQQHDTINGEGKLPMSCTFSGCHKTFNRKGELDRHHREQHDPTHAEFLCPDAKCPRSLEGEGFKRLNHVVNHLQTGKHSMDSQQARLEAAKHNKPVARKGGSEISCRLS